MFITLQANATSVVNLETQGYAYLAAAAGILIAWSLALLPS